MSAYSEQKKYNESGNVLFIILIAIVLIGALTAAVQQSNNSESSNIDNETLAIRASEVQSYASELERAVRFVLENGVSEIDIRFAHASAHADYGDIDDSVDGRQYVMQVFHPDGGAATYRNVPSGITTSASAWEFTGASHMPGVGTAARSDLIAVLPNVTAAFCEKINELNNQTATPAATSCPYTDAGRFDSGTNFDDDVDESSTTIPPVMTEATFSTQPALQACVVCGGNNYFYHVIMAR
ncbi:MAG: hypothetical protein KTR28_05085 [Micavibrio sp.]|nr:hypothetical protein [Micavibrio sp.]